MQSTAFLVAMKFGRIRRDERCHWLPTSTDQIFRLKRDISKARTECHRMSCIYETLSSPFLDPLLFPPFEFRLLTFLFLLPLSPVPFPLSPFPPSTCASDHFVVSTLSHPPCLSLGQVTYKTGVAVPKPADVPKWVMPTEMYSARPSTVLAYKKAHQVGRFDPAAPEILEQKIAQMWKEIEERGSLDFPRSQDA